MAEPAGPGADPYEPLTALIVGRIGMVIRLQVRPGGRPVLLDALHRYADDLAEEPGTEMFTISVDPDDEDLVWLYEWFTDADAQRAHQASGAFARMAAELADVLASPPGVLRLDPLRASFQRSLIQTLA